MFTKSLCLIQRNTKLSTMKFEGKLNVSKSHGKVTYKKVLDFTWETQLKTKLICCHLLGDINTNSDNKY